VKSYLSAFALGSLGGWIFSLLRMPIPWTLGPLVFIAIAEIGFKVRLYWSSQIRNIALLILGYSMGRAFTPDTGQRIWALFPLLMLVTLISIALCLFGGFIIHKSTGLSLSTCLFGSIPGGLSQTATICEEVEDADLAAVTLMQTIRVLAVVSCVPFIALHGLSNQSTQVSKSIVTLGSSDLLSLVLFSVIIGILTFISRYLKLPGGYIISPLLGTAVLTLVGVPAPALPPSIISIAQICVGILMGMSLNFATLANWKKITLQSLLNNLGILGGLMGLNYLITKISPITFLTAFIGTAPGGMAEMGITAMMVNADLSTVVAFQLSRLLFVLVIVFPLMSWLFRRKRNKSQGVAL
jgi:membrane AbrB-like protein